MNKGVLLIRQYFFFIALFSIVQSCSTKKPDTLILSCNEKNDLFRTLRENRVKSIRYNTPGEAINKAEEGSGVLILADGYPSKTTVMDDTLYAKARKKKLRMYIEYPSFIPGMDIGAPRGTHWERAVVSSDAFSPALEKLRILAIHDCRFITMKVENPDIVIARIAGFDSAVYGLPEETFPVLSEIIQPVDEGSLLIASTKLSQFITARYAPADAWVAIWSHIFTWLQPGEKISELKWIPAVRPSFNKDEKLPEDIETQALKRGIEWYFNSRMVISPSMMARYNQPTNGPYPASADPDTTQKWPYGHRIGLMPDMQTPVGDGSLGVMEGFDAKIFYNGTQPVRWWIRSDCDGEIAGAMSAAGIALKNPDYQKVGRNIGDWLYFRSSMSLGDRANPDHPAYGLIGWNNSPEYCGPGTMDGYAVYYDDDNARTMLGMMIAGSALKTNDYDERLLKCFLGNLRLTGKLGFMADRIDQNILEKNGWEHYFNDSTLFYSPGMQSYVWACYLWAYQQTGFDLFLQRAKNGINMTMETFPQNMIWNNTAKARMLLPLAWLVRIEDTPEHRTWLHSMAEGLMQNTDGSIHEVMRKEKWAAPPATNEEYGTAEATLMQTDNDRVSDILYTTNFAFVGLHEAAMATGEAFYIDAEEKLAKFLCRIQIRSETHPELDGGWFRAFDLKRWEYWASSTDAGWGAWSIESGWTQSWITTIFALRKLNTSIWDITRDSKIEEHFGKVLSQMFPGK